MNWHADAALLERYASGDADQTLGFSLEAHLMKCATCREGLVPYMEPARRQRVWNEVQSQLDEPRPGPVERLLLRARVPDHIARLLASTPSLRLSWLLAVAATLGFGVAAAHQSRAGFVFFLVVAPLLPLAGVAAAYGPGVDPTYEVGLASAMRSTKLLLIRAMAVLVTTVPLAALAGFALPVVDWRAAAWLLPSLALSLTSLALSTVVSPLRGALGVAVAWVALSVGAAELSSDLFAAFRARSQVVFALVAVVSAAAFIARRDVLETRRNR